MARTPCMESPASSLSRLRMAATLVVDREVRLGPVELVVQEVLVEPVARAKLAADPVGQVELAGPVAQADQAAQAEQAALVERAGPEEAEETVGPAEQAALVERADPAEAAEPVGLIPAREIWARPPKPPNRARFC